MAEKIERVHFEPQRIANELSSFLILAAIIADGDTGGNTGARIGKTIATMKYKTHDSNQSSSNIQLRISLLYATLDYLEACGLIKESKKQYTITKSGYQFFMKEKERLKDFFGSINGLLEHTEESK